MSSAGAPPWTWMLSTSSSVSPGSPSSLTPSAVRSPAAMRMSQCAQLLHVIVVVNGVLTNSGSVAAQGAGKNSCDSEFITVTYAAPTRPPMSPVSAAMGSSRVFERNASKWYRRGRSRRTEWIVRRATLAGSSRRARPGSPRGGSPRRAGVREISHYDL